MKSLLLCFPVSSMLWVAAASAQTAQPKDKEPSRPPQVRTYSTVTVVDDPAKAPRLPTQKQAPQPAKETPTAAKDAQTPVPSAKEPASQPKELVPASRSDSKSAMKDVASADRKNIDLLRQDLRSTAKELRESQKRDTIRDPGIGATPAPKRAAPDQTPSTESRREHRLRQILQERAGRDN
ncbi:MAG TPA: hypothetical protein PKW11_12310 [Pseudomonadota bacterium]|jgi:hypothetical protein|nr:hypothetical protein [Pseudomonadota bacterium]